MPSLTTCRGCAERIDGDAELAFDGFYYHPTCLNGDAVARQTARDREEIALRLASPKRPGHVDAADVNHLPLFVAANEPTFL
jgi:hypothetical protein